MVMITILRHFVPTLHPVRWAIINGMCLVWSIFLLSLIFFYPDDPRSQDFVRRNYYVYDLITCIVWVLEMAMDVSYYIGLLGSRRRKKQYTNNQGDDISSVLNQTMVQDPKCETVRDSGQQPKQILPDPHMIPSLTENNSQDEDDRNSLLQQSICCQSFENAACTDEQCRTHSLFIEFVFSVYFLGDSITMSEMELREIRREDEHLTLDVIINAAAYLYITIRQYREWNQRRRRRLNLEESSMDSDNLVVPESEVGLAVSQGVYA
mmetsp:Transcript_17081/g.34774  ORF Transcript_17081/g.34774 Transcript_17081/m.34774 type:complete len:265 (+) Transcript_17081:149-943(+)